MTDTPRKDGPRTEAGRRLLAKLDDIGRSPLSGVSFPDPEDDIARIEAEAAAGPKPAPSTTPQAPSDQERRASGEPRRDDVAGSGERLGGYVTLDDLTAVVNARMPDGATFVRDDGKSTTVLRGEALAASLLHLATPGGLA